ncbi:8-oxoguanine DNA glycosylase OGG fold protein [Dyadobacter bucti]|uniref:8-oxoguanine DNA glycosylase OGG fold protein n=1 Tax=Dyadobacter bucti TaxID=2572203 RepID=UPI0011084F76|nr:hypothetical protein [Dyadobacter bucti]
MTIRNYSDLIRSLPVRQQSFSTKRSTWEKAERQIPWLAQLNDKIFSNNKDVTISRQDIFATGDIRELIVRTIYWGYPRGMRGNYAIIIFYAIENIEVEFTSTLHGDLEQSIGPSNLTGLIDFFNRIEGLGIATLTKLLYFNNVSFEGYPCLILDSRIINVLKRGEFDELRSLRYIRYANSIVLYKQYLQVMLDVSKTLDTSCDSLEQFLFLFGGNLKVE